MKRWLMVAGMAALALLLAAALGLCLRYYTFGLTRVTGTSMQGTLRDGDVALVTRWDYRNGKAPKLGDVVECRFPGREDAYIKRVAGLPGQRAVIHSGVLYLDGRRVSEPYVSSFAKDWEMALGEDQYLLLGDNRAESYDSRMPDIGPVNSGAFIGRVRYIVWPLRRAGVVK